MRHITETPLRQPLGGTPRLLRARVDLDHARRLPALLRRHVGGHSVDTAYERGWSDSRNDDLLARAELDGFELLITTDCYIQYQQNPS